LGAACGSVVDCATPPLPSVLVVVAAVADEATLTFVPHDAQKFASFGRLYPQQGHFMMVPFVAVFR
jgi:hypothetical protein